MGLTRGIKTAHLVYREGLRILDAKELAVHRPGKA